jgi:short-subunit dehydrogenase
VKELRGKTAIVTGAARGAGVHIAAALAAEGMDLVLVDRAADALVMVANDIGRTGARVVHVVADVTSETDRRSIVDAAAQWSGHADALVNNAAIIEWVPFERQDPEHIARIVETNLLAPLYLSRMLLPGMLERRCGHIVNHGSMSGKRGMPYTPVYGASKAGLVLWGEALRMELKGTGVGVTAVISTFITEAGMSADHGLPAPRYSGPVSPGRVARAVVRALRQDPPEIIVSSMPIRPLLVVTDLFPRLSDPVLRATGVAGLHRRLGERHHQSF